MPGLLTHEAEKEIPAVPQDDFYHERGDAYWPQSFFDTERQLVSAAKRWKSNILVDCRRDGLLDVLSCRTQLHRIIATLM